MDPSICCAFKGMCQCVHFACCGCRRMEWDHLVREGQKTGLGEVEVEKDIKYKRRNETGLRSAVSHCLPHHQQAAAHLIGTGHLTQNTKCLVRDLRDHSAAENLGLDKVILYGGIHFASTSLLLHQKDMTWSLRASETDELSMAVPWGRGAALCGSVFCSRL